jgi:hypothetical protein
MAESQYNNTVQGQEVSQVDINLVGQTSGLADDRVIQELIRLTPFDGTNVYKAIVPYGLAPIAGTIVAPTFTVMPTGSANGSIAINPFRAVVGSRVNPTTVPLALQWWRDIRSGIFIGSTTPPQQAIQLSPNGSPNPRWDLVYASLTVDAPSPNVQRRQQDPVLGTIAPVTVSTTLVQTVSVSVLAGTPAAAPVPPPIPADSGTTFNMPLALIRVRSGFGSTTTVTAGDVRDYATNGLGDVAAIYERLGVSSVRPANGNNDGAGTYATDALYAWSTSPGTRPGVFLPPQMQGGVSVFAECDFTNAAHPSHAQNSVVDSSVDWRGRVVRVWASASTTDRFANDQVAISAHQGIPAIPGKGISGQEYQLGNTLNNDGTVSTGNPSIYLGTPATIGAANMGAASSVGLYVDATSGAIKVLTTGTPSCRIWFLVEAFAQFPNS